MTIELHPHDALTGEPPELPDWRRGSREEDFAPFPSMITEISGHPEEMAPRGDDE